VFSAGPPLEGVVEVPGVPVGVPSAAGEVAPLILALELVLEEVLEEVLLTGAEGRGGGGGGGEGLGRRVTVPPLLELSDPSAPGRRGISIGLSSPDPSESIPPSSYPPDSVGEKKQVKSNVWRQPTLSPS
jgi:hypothetical protein